MKRFPEMVLRQHGDASVWVVEEYAAAPDVALLADADRLFEGRECEVVKDQRKIKVARIGVILGGQARALYLKRYNCFSWRIALGSWFRPSGAIKALRGAELLAEARISTARPIAAVESRRWGMVARSFFFSEEIERGKTLDAFWRDDLARRRGGDGLRRRRRFLRELASLFRSLHSRQVYHGDLKDANILVVGGAQERADCFFLLDLEGIRKYGRLSERRRIKNLVQLNRTFGRYLRATEKLRFLKEYLGGGFFDRRQKRRWASRISRRSAALDRRKYGAAAAGGAGVC